jgi:hypothetical protein
LCAASRKRLQPPAPRLSRRPRHVVPRHRQPCRRLLPLPPRPFRSRLRLHRSSRPLRPRPHRPRPLRPRPLRSPRLRPHRWPLPLPPLQRRLRPRLPRQAVRLRPHPARQPRPRPLHPLRLRPHGRRPRMPARPRVRVRCPVPVAPADCPVASASPAHRVRATTRSPRVRAWAFSVPVPKVHRQPPPVVPASVPPSALTVPAARARPETACRGPVAASQACPVRTRP